jgi:hypothetical protein
MKGQIKRVLAILFAVLFVVTLTASAVSAEEVATLTAPAVSVDKVVTLTVSAAGDDGGFSCGTLWPRWWWPWPPGPWPWDDLDIDGQIDISSAAQIGNVQEITSVR